MLAGDERHAEHGMPVEDGRSPPVIMLAVSERDT